ncbi:MAG: HlyC/CorC family transporter [Acutalibacteraceae bacterium]
MGIVILICVMLSAFFSATETAYSTVNTVRMNHDAELGNKRAKGVVYITQHYDNALTTILIGNNIVNIGCSSIATVLCMNLFGDAGAAISTGALTLIILTFGEIIPKCLAKEHAESIAMATAKILRILMTVLKPVVFCFMKLKQAALALVNKGDKTPSVTEDELKYIIDSIEEEGVLEQQERELVKSALDFDEKTVQEVLTPRVDLTAIDIDDDENEIRKIIFEERYSRIPVYEKSIDNIVGVLHTRDYLEALANGESVDLHRIIQPAYYVYKNKKLSYVLSDMKHKHQNLALVTDEHGGILGIVTVEDLVEELVGEIWDEDEEIEAPYKRVDENTLELSGDYSLEDLSALLNIKESEFDSESVSLGGWIFEKLGKIPDEGEAFEFCGYKFKILDVSEQRITLVSVTKI